MSVMPQALRISSEMLMFDRFGSSPGLTCGAFGLGTLIVLFGTTLAVGTVAGGGGSEAQPAAKAREEKMIAAAYFMTSSLARPRTVGRALYTSIVQIPRPSARGTLEPANRARCGSSPNQP